MKLIILMMSCNKKHFKVEGAAMKKTINKHIKKLKLTDEITVYDYVGDAETLYMNDTTINCTAGDDLFNTYHKTLEALKYINNNIEYDYIFRTNTSTFINIELLYNIVKKIYKNNDTTTIWGSEITCVPNTFCPILNDWYIRGNGLLLSHNNVDLILKYKFEFMDLEKYPNGGMSFDVFDHRCSAYIDDICIGTVMNIINYQNYTWKTIPGNCLKIWKHGWYDCKSEWDKHQAHVNNGVCSWENMNIDYNFLKQFVTIQIKSYKLDRTYKYDVKKIKVLSNVFINKTDPDINQTVEENMNFTEHSYAFIGSWRKIPYMPIMEVLSYINNYRED